LRSGQKNLDIPGQGSVYVRFLKIILPICISVFIILISIFEGFNYLESSQRLLDKLQTLSATYSLILAESVQQEDQEEISLYSISLISDTDISGLRILNRDNIVLENFGAVENDPEDLKCSLSINYADESGLRQVGKLIISVSRQNILEELRRRVVYEVVLLLALIAAVLLGAKIAYRHSVGKPLQALTRAIQKFELDPQHEDISIYSDDELGTVIGAYNNMQKQRLIAEQKLQDYQRLLEQRVDTSTSNLSSEISRHKDTAEQLFLEQQRAEVTLNSIADAVLTTDTNGKILYINPAGIVLLGLDGQQSLARNINEVLHLKTIDSHEPITNLVKNCTDSYEIGEALLTSLTCSEHIVEVTAKALREQRQKVIGISVVLRDITDSRKLAQKLTYQASHDALTELINRREFERLLGLLHREAEELNHQHVMCFLDLDHFKIVNDTSGHMAGDELLRRVAAELRKQLRQGDILARLGSDEFGVLLPNCNLENARRITSKMCNAVNEMRFSWGDNLFRLSLSVGVVPVLASSAGIEELLTQADASCYIAKQSGRNRVHVSDKDDQEIVRRKHEVRWISEIIRAFEQDSFQIWYQRIADLRDASDAIGDSSRCEILVRMVTDDGKHHTPGVFMSTVERHGYAVDLDKLVLRRCLQWLQSGEAAKHGIDQCAINLSGISLGSQAFLDYVVEQLDNHHVSASQICFEITETAVISNVAVAQQFIDTLKARGCSFALDDFGSGLSSFGYLRNLAVDYLKIEGSFVRDIGRDRVDYELVRTINSIGHIMEMKTIAEFVEDPEILQLVGEIGIDYAQGYYLHRPEACYPANSGKLGLSQQVN